MSIYNGSDPNNMNEEPEDPPRLDRMHLGQRNGDIPPEIENAMHEALLESDDQWSTALELASAHVGESDPHLAKSIVHDIALATMARICMSTRRKLRLFHGWEVLDETTCVTVAHEGFVYANGLVIDDDSIGVLLAPESSLSSISTDPWVVIRYQNVWRAEIDWSEHSYEGTVEVEYEVDDD